MESNLSSMHASHGLFDPCHATALPRDEPTQRLEQGEMVGGMTAKSVPSQPDLALTWWSSHGCCGVGGGPCLQVSAKSA